LVTVMLAAAAAPQARDERLPGWFDLAVPGGEATLLALDLSLEERAFTLPVLARALHDRDHRGPTFEPHVVKLLAQLKTQTDNAADVISVPAPLDAEVWRDLLPPVKPPASHDLFARIISDRNALLTASALIATDDSVRSLVARDRELLRFIYQHGAGALTIAARRLRIADGRVVVPGGPASEAVWQSLVGVPPTRPGPFVRALLTKDHGRLAWYYDAIGGLTADRLAAAWPDSPDRLAGAGELYSAFRDTDPQWRVMEQPFRRNAIDAWMVLSQNVMAQGAVVSALPQQTWELLFSDARPGRSQIARSLQGGTTRVSASWLVRETVVPLVRERRHRYEMFRLAQRVFADAPPDTRVDVAIAVSGVRRSRALALTLERMEITDARTWAAAMDAARHVTDDADDQRAALATFQATLALIERMRHSRVLDAGLARRLVHSLSDTVRADTKVVESIARWITSELIAALPPLVQPDAFTATTAYESILLQALAGPSPRPIRTLEWEGLAYVVDPVAAEHDRLRGMRAMLPSPGLDAALASSRPRDLADALTALVYATALGDPEGPASLSPDVASRHDFGLTSTMLIREELPWAPPEERQGYGPWRVQGSLLGLDLALARLFLRRIADQQMPAAPSLTLNDFATLARTGAALVASDLTDSDRDAIAEAVERGRERVRRARSTAEFLALGRECGMSDTTQQLLTWMSSRQREVVPDVFSLRDLLWLGRPSLSVAALNRWGVAGDGLDGRRVLTMPGPAPWEDYAGRSDVGQITTQVPDLTLRLVEETARLKLPAALVPSLLAFALEDYWHDVRARFADDWPRLTRHAATLSSSRINDYVAALAGGGPLRAQ
jgi:hypothetical protein